MTLNVIYYSISFMKENVEFEKFSVRLFRDIVFSFEKKRCNKS